MSTKDFKFRLENERDELRTKVLKLADFLGRIITEDMNITPIQLTLLNIQLPAMKIYLGILDQRLLSL